MSSGKRNQNEVDNELIQSGGQLNDLYQDIGDTIQTGIVDAIDTGIRGLIQGTEDLDKALQEIAAGILADIGRQLISFGINQAFSGFGIPMFANGGRPDVGKPAIVGERGPELFIPDTAGTGLSNDESRAAMARYNSGNQSVSSDAATSSPDGGGGSQTALAMPTFKLETTMINSVEYATVDQVRAMGAEAAAAGAQQGEAKTMRRLQMSASTRRKLGMQ